MTAYTLTTELCDEGLRLDRFLSEELEDHSRSFLQKLIKEGWTGSLSRPITGCLPVSRCPYRCGNRKR